MRRYATGMLLLAGLLLLAPASAVGRTYEIDYATWDVKVTDSKGVVTEATEFGFYTGANVLMAKRGDGYIEIPFRKLRSIEIGTYIPSKGYYPSSVTSRKGKVIKVEVERVEAHRFLGGDTEVGTYRIRLGQMKKLELLRLSQSDGL